jgi:hypothetical protein
MNVLFVHGVVAQQGGAMERAVRAACESQRDQLIVLRWPSGDLRKLAGRSVGKVAAELAVDPSWRGLSHAVTEFLTDTFGDWASAQVALLETRAKLSAAIRALEKRREPYNIMAFSLGCELAATTLCIAPQKLEYLESAMFVAAAMDPGRYSNLQKCPALDDVDFINVWSSADSVLSRLFPVVAQVPDAAGTAPVLVPRVRDREVDSGHLNYGAVAEQLLADLRKE